jgi:hypothetical protein
VGVGGNGAALVVYAAVAFVEGELEDILEAFIVTALVEQDPKHSLVEIT